jgi:hypothetical protein
MRLPAAVRRFEIVPGDGRGFQFESGLTFPHRNRRKPKSGANPALSVGDLWRVTCSHASMILLITALARAQDCAKALQEVAAEPVQVAANLCEAVAQLQAHEFSAVVLDQLLLDAEPDDVETIFKHMGTAVPVYSNFAVSGIERVSRELRSAVHRRKRELLMARQEAEQDLRSQLRGTITALLLSCEMALGVPNLPQLAETKMRAVDALAKEMRAKLGATA